MWIFNLSGKWRFGVEVAQRLKVYTGTTNNGRFLNGAELTCPMAMRPVETCLWDIGNRCSTHKVKVLI